MGNEQDRFPFPLKVFKLTVALRLEEYVSNRQRLVDDQDLRIDVDCDSKGKSYEHAA